MTDAAEYDIYRGDYSLISRTLYGGLCSGGILLPTNFFKIILTLIFPPLGTILEIIGEFLIDEFPYITWNTLKILFDYNNFNKIIYTFILTSMFYVPGLVYTLAQLTTSPSNTRATLQCDADGNCVDLSKLPTEPAPT
jgi:uncharacterized membrane protein YqaE (UPF0057 family)